jgi:hypothetical protein
MFNSIVQGWINYFGHFYKSMLYPLLRRIDDHLMRWAMRKYKRLRGRERLARELMVEASRVITLGYRGVTGAGVSVATPASARRPQASLYCSGATSIRFGNAPIDPSITLMCASAMLCSIPASSRSDVTNDTSTGSFDRRSSIIPITRRLTDRKVMVRARVVPVNCPAGGTVVRAVRPRVPGTSRDQWAQRTPATVDQERCDHVQQRCAGPCRRNLVQG